MNPKSEFIKKKIKGKSFSDKDYLEYTRDLCDLERFIITRTGSVNSIIRFNSFRKKYEKEFLAIFKELDHDGYASIVAEETHSEQECDKRLLELYADDKKVLRCEKRRWLSLGGKL